MSLVIGSTYGVLTVEIPEGDDAVNTTHLGSVEAMRTRDRASKLTEVDLQSQGVIRYWRSLEDVVVLCQSACIKQV